MRWIPVLGLIAALLPTQPAFGQEAGRIVGTVTGTAGAPLSGAQVQVVGTALGAVTGPNGEYTISPVPAGTHRLRTSLIGYADREATVRVAAGETATASFQLTSEALALEGIVVVGYGTQQARDVTGSVATVTPEAIKQIPTPNAIEALKGKIPGVDVVTTGYEPGAGVRVRIRGTRSIGAGNEPLYVVDGIPLAGGIQDFNPADIASMDVLKDASATAVYGSRGANGVVLITTKRGRPGATRITYETYYGIQDPHNKIDVFTGPEFAEFKREAFRTVGKYKCPERTVCAEGDTDLFSADELAGLQNGVSTDWQDLIVQQGAQQSHHVGISGGNADTRFAVTGSYFDQTGITRGTDYNRILGSFSVDHEAGRLNLGVSATGSKGVENEGPGNGLWTEALLDNPLGSARDADGNLIALPVPDGLRWNPLLDIENQFRENSRTRIFASIYGAYELADGLTFRSQIGPDLTFRREGEFRGAMTGARRGGTSDAWLFRDQTFAYTWSNFLTLDRQIGSDHQVNATALYEIQQQDYDLSRAETADLPYEHQLWYNLGSGGLVEGVQSRLEEWSLQSYMGRVNYGFRDKYLLTLTGRLDGSSRLAPENRYSFFPSVAFAWRLGDEAFIANTGFFSDLKLRASYGVTGNTSIDPYQTQGALYRTTYSFAGIGAFGYRPGALQNPGLQWEKTRSYNVGVDFSVLNDRIAGTADFYVQNTFDLLLERQLPPTSGFSSILENIGKTRNTGFEMGLSTINLDGWHGLSWTSDINWATNRNEIVSLYGGNEDDVGNIWFIGSPINAPGGSREARTQKVFYDYEFAGIWQLDQAEEAASFGQKPGEIRVIDQNGDGRIDGEDRIIIGSTYPKWTGSLSNRFEWGSFDLSALLTARWGYLISSDFHDNFNSLFGRYNNLDVNYWTPDNASNTDPRPNADQERPLYDDSRRYKDGSHVRVRNITLGYQVPSSFTNRFGGESLRIYATAQDPFVFTSYDGFDPESGDIAGSPSYRTLLVGASVGF